MSNRRFASRRGIALIVVLWVMVLLAVVAADAIKAAGRLSASLRTRAHDLALDDRTEMYEKEP